MASAPLVGRERECDQLYGLLAQARAGHGASLVICGEPRVGKTALLDDLRRHARDWLVLSTRGVEPETQLAFAGLAEVLDPLLELRASLPSPRRAALESALGLSAPRPGDRFATYAATLGLLAEAAERAPVLVAIDDAHWLDAASLESLRFCARRIGHDRIVLILCAREAASEDVDSTGVPELRLSGLSAEAAARLLERHAPVPVASRVVAARPPPDRLPVGPAMQRAFESEMARLPRGTQTALLPPLRAQVSNSPPAAAWRFLMSSLRRCTRALAPAFVVGLLVIAVAPAAAAGYDDAGYLAYDDRMEERLDRLWEERRGFYRPGEGGTDALLNANLLLIHSVAAHAGHSGPARNDARARRIAEALVSSPVFVERPAAHPAVGSQPHAPGWTSGLYDDQAPQHVMFDAQIVDALVHAWRARRELGLPPRTVGLIVDRIHRVARSRFWRWPSIRLNQINWYALVYAADATVTGDPTLLRHDLHAQLTRFVNGRRNFAAGMRFQYVPQQPPAAPANVDSAEYSNMVLSFLRFYVQGRRAGMAPLPRAGRALVRRWIRRAIAGYWTHGGYLNWDTGLGFERWHLGKKYGLAQQALIGIAQTSRLQPGRTWGRWAKWMFDRGLAVYERLPVTETGLPAHVRFGLFSLPQSTGDAQLTATQLAANAARAVDAGLGRMRGEAPPPLYAFDPDIGRLAITTPTYNTAIIAVNQRAFPYGGIELARLFDAGQDVAANIGGRAPSAFGLLVRTPSGARVFASQTGRARVHPEVSPVRLTRAPMGTRATARSKPGDVFAGRFHELRARSVLTAGHLRAVTSHRFTGAFIDTRWRLDRLRGRARLRADVIFPTWGQDAVVTALLRDGTRVRIGAGRAVALAAVARFEISSARSGYSVAPLRRPRGAIARVILPSRQSSQPDPGPTLAIEIERGARWSRARFAARIRVHTR